MQQLLDSRYSVLNPTLFKFMEAEKRFFDECAQQFGNLGVILNRLKDMDSKCIPTPCTYDCGKYIRGKALLEQLGIDVPSVEGSSSNIPVTNMYNQNVNKDYSYEAYKGGNNKNNSFGPTANFGNDFGSSPNPFASNYQNSNNSGNNKYSYQNYKQEVNSINNALKNNPFATNNNNNYNNNYGNNNYGMGNKNDPFGGIGNNNKDPFGGIGNNKNDPFSGTGNNPYQVNNNKNTHNDPFGNIQGGDPFASGRSGGNNNNDPFANIGNNFSDPFGNNNKRDPFA